MASELTLEINGHKRYILGYYLGFHRNIQYNRPVQSVWGGEIWVEMTSGSDTVFLEMLMAEKEIVQTFGNGSKLATVVPTPVSGKIQFVKDDKIFRELSFQEAYVIFYREQMSSVGPKSMTTQIVISPICLEINRQIKMRKIQPSGICLGWAQFIEEAPKPIHVTPYSPPTLLVKSAIGETEALPNEVIEYKVTSYNLSNVSDSDRKRVKWDIEIDGKREKQKEQGEILQLPIKEEWAGKEIIVMPYLKQATSKICVKVKVKDTKNYKVIPSQGTIEKDFDLPPQVEQYMINRRKSNELTIKRLERKIIFHSAVVELGIKKITNDYNNRFGDNFPDEYYEEFGMYVTELLIYKHQLIGINKPVKEALNEVIKIIDNENGFNNGLGAPLFHIYENVVRKNDDTGFDKLLHFMFSAKHAYCLSPTISKVLGISKEFIKDEMYSWIDDAEKGWDDLDMKANKKGFEYGKKLSSKYQ